MSDPKSKDFFDKFLSGFIQTVGEDSEHFREANEAVVTGRGDDYKAQSRFSKMMAEHPTIATLQDLFEKGDADLRNERKARGMGLSDDNVTRTGQVTGRVAQDIVRDSSRSVWWLLNAPQAVVDVAAEELIRRANPDLKSESVVRDAAGNKVYYDTADPRAAEKAGAVKDGVKQKGYSFGAGESYQTEDGKGDICRAPAVEWKAIQLLFLARTILRRQQTFLQRLGQSTLLDVPVTCFRMTSSQKLDLMYHKKNTTGTKHLNTIRVWIWIRETVM